MIQQRNLTLFICINVGQIHTHVKRVFLPPCRCEEVDEVVI